MRNDIYRRRQSLVSVSSGGSEAHLSVFLNQHCASNLLSFACSFPPSRSLSLSQIGLLSACRPSRKRTSLCCSLISPCAPHWLCLLGKHKMLCRVHPCTFIFVRTRGRLLQQCVIILHNSDIYHHRIHFVEIQIGIQLLKDKKAAMVFAKLCISSH